MNADKNARTILREVVKNINDSKWDSVTWSPDDPRLHAQIDALVPRLNRGGVLLDIGTGAGIIPEVFHRLGYSVVSVDYPKTGGYQALTRLTKMGIVGHFAQVGVERLPLADGSADIVFVGDVIEHLPHSPKPFLLDLVRTLRPGGFMILTTPNATRLEMRLKMLFGGSPWPALQDYIDDEVNRHHHKEYKGTELKFLLEQVHLQVEEIGYYNWRYESAAKRTIHGALLPLLSCRPTWKSGLLAVGKRTKTA